MQWRGGGAGGGGLAVVAPTHLHSTQQPQPVYKRKHLFSLLPPSTACPAVLRSRCLAGAFPSFTIQGCPPPNRLPPGSSMPGKPTAAATPATERLKKIPRGPVRRREVGARRALAEGARGSTPAPRPAAPSPVGIARFGAAGTWPEEPWFTRPRWSVLPPTRVQNTIPRCPELGFPSRPIPPVRGIPSLRGRGSPGSLGRGRPAPLRGVTRRQMGRALPRCAARGPKHPPPTTPLQLGPTGGTPLLPPPPTPQRVCCRPRSSTGAAPKRWGAAVTPSPGSAPSLPTPSRCQEPNVGAARAAAASPARAGLSTSRAG